MYARLDNEIPEKIDFVDFDEQPAFYKFLDGIGELKKLDEVIKDMNFRHFFRHSYGYSMKWGKLSHLFLNLETNWAEVKNELEIFVEKLR